MTAAPVIVLEALAMRGQPTGVAGGARELIAALAARDRGFAFVVVAGDDDVFADLRDRPGWSLEVVPAGDATRREWTRQVLLPVACRRWGAALVHGLQPVAPWAAPCPVVLTVHDLAWRTMPEVIPQPRRAWLSAAVPASLARARLLLANSRTTAAALTGAFPRLADRVREVPHGTPAWALAGDLPAPAPVAHPFFLFVGRLEPRKNLPRLLEAYERLVVRTDGQAPDLCLAGPEGWGLGPVRERLARPSLAGRVRVTGWCAPADLRALYAAALALVFPSLDEGFGLPVLEAMGCGLPVLTADRGATAEVAGDAALLVDPQDTQALADAMFRLARDAALRTALAAGGRRRAATWTWERTADLTAAAYAEIAAPAAARK
ncbi:glycosyltransferase family 4 protein [bacterium]|nr:glycosyltransferase family 4 protein [bacterium]